MREYTYTKSPVCSKIDYSDYADESITDKKARLCKNPRYRKSHMCAYHAWERLFGKPPIPMGDYTSLLDETLRDEYRIKEKYLDEFSRSI